MSDNIVVKTEETKTKMKEACKTRQTKYSDSFVEEILQELSNNKSVKEVAEQYGIPKTSIHRWLNGNRRSNRTEFDETLKEEAKTKKKTNVHNEEIKKKILEELEKGVQVKELSEKYGIPNQTISSWKTKPSGKVVHSEETKRKVIEYVQEGHTKADAGRVFNVPTQTVSRWCN